MGVESLGESKRVVKRVQKCARVLFDPAPAGRRRREKEDEVANFAITSVADVAKACASGRMKEMTAPFGATDPIRSSVTPPIGEWN
jgi:hypothetical protein